MRYLRVSQAFAEGYNSRARNGGHNLATWNRTTNTFTLPLYKCPACQQHTALELGTAIIFWQQLQVSHPAAYIALCTGNCVTWPEIARPICMTCRTRDGCKTKYPVLSVGEVFGITSGTLCGFDMRQQVRIPSEVEEQSRNMVKNQSC